MKPRLRTATALPGLILLLLPACMQVPPTVQRQSGTYVPPQTMAATPSARTNPVLSPYGLVDYARDADKAEPRLATRRPARRPNPPAEVPDEEPDGPPAPIRVQESPEIETSGQPIQRVSVTAPAIAPPPVPVAAPDPPLIQAMRRYIDKRPDLAVELLRQYPAENQDALLVLLPLTFRMTQGGLRETNPQEMAAMVDELQQLQQMFQPMATLKIDKLCFCRQI
ncbi:MAG TPA: hypothetical protein VGZ47_23210, partial [Gemmataceae bacterium]|nr:hypothetical protein [Gemmataceae bacterium]